MRAARVPVWSHRHHGGVTTPGASTSARGFAKPPRTSTGRARSRGRPAAPDSR